ncbi:hypothetical protein BaRGS_00023243, partial [Batillaria attramentaria]
QVVGRAAVRKEMASWTKWFMTFALAVCLVAAGARGATIPAQTPPVPAQPPPLPGPLQTLIAAQDKRNSIGRHVDDLYDDPIFLEELLKHYNNLTVNSTHDDLDDWLDDRLDDRNDTLDDWLDDRLDDRNDTLDDRLDDRNDILDDWLDDRNDILDDWLDDRNDTLDDTLDDRNDTLDDIDDILEDRSGLADDDMQEDADRDDRGELGDDTRELGDDTEELGDDMGDLGDNRGEFGAPHSHDNLALRRRLWGYDDDKYDDHDLFGDDLHDDAASFHKWLSSSSQTPANGKSRTSATGSCPTHPVIIEENRVTIATQNGCKIVIQLTGKQVVDVTTVPDSTGRVLQSAQVAYIRDD